MNIAVIRLSASDCLDNKIRDNKIRNRNYLRKDYSILVRRIFIVTLIKQSVTITQMD